MATLDSAARRRPGVQVYSPGRALPPEITGRMTGAQYVQRQQRASATPQASPWGDLAAKYQMSDENLKAQQKQAQDEAMAALPGWKRTVANVVENPVVKYGVLAPLSLPSRIVNVGLEEGFKLLPDSWEQRLNKPFGDDPKWSTANQVATRITGGMDPEKIHDGQSVLSRLNAWGDTPSGASEMYTDIDIPGVTGLSNFVLDVAHDPLTYVSMGGTRVGVSALEAGKTAAAADRAVSLVSAVERTGDDAAIKAARKAADEAVALANKAATPVKTTLPHTQKARADLISEVLVGNPELAEQFGTQFQKGVRQGFRFMNPEARAALGIDKIGLRLNGTNLIIPGTEKLTAPLARAGLAGRTAYGKLPKPSGAVRGAEDTAKILAGQHGDILRAAGQRVGLNQARIFEGRAKNLGVHELVNSVKTDMKKMSAAQREEMVYLAETTPGMEPLNNLAKNILDINQSITGTVIDDAYKLAPEQYMPHILDPAFRRMLKNKLEKGTDLEKLHADAFLTANGKMKAKDLLETSGFLDKRRVFRPNADGSPAVIKIGTKGELGEIVIADGTIRGLNNNASLRDLFPGYTGKFYMDDPVKIFDAYNSSLARDAGRTGSMNMLADTALPFVERITGETADELRRFNDNTMRQSEAFRTAEMVRANPLQPGSPTIVVPPAPPTPPPSRFFSEVVGRNATKDTRKFFSGKNSELGQYLDTVNEEINRVVEPAKAQLGTLRKNMMVGLRAEAEASEAALKPVSAEIRKYQKRLADLGKLTPENAEQMGDLLDTLDLHIADLKHELGSRRSLFGRARKAIHGVISDLDIRTAGVERQTRTKARKASKAVAEDVDVKLDKMLKWMQQLRDRADAEIGDGPKALAAEIRRRNDELFRPVREAAEILERKKAALPAPHTDDEVARARTLLGQDVGDIDPAYTSASEEYASRLRRLDAAHKGATKNRKGQISIPAQAEIDAATKAVQEQRLVLGQMTGKGSPYRAAKNKANDLRTQLAGLGDEVAVPEETAKTVDDARKWLANELLNDPKVPGNSLDVVKPRVDALTVKNIELLLDQRYPGGSKKFFEWSKNTAAPKADKTRAALQAELERIESQFRQRGKFHAQQQAEDILAADKKWQDDVAKATAAEQKAYDRARQAAHDARERVVTDQSGQRLRGVEGFASGQERRVGEPLPVWQERQNTPERTELEALAQMRAQSADAGVRARQEQVAALEARIEKLTTEHPTVKKEARAAAVADVKAQAQPTLDNLQEQRARAVQLLDVTTGIHTSRSAYLTDRIRVIEEVMPRIADRQQLTQYRAELKSLVKELASASTNPNTYRSPNEVLGVVDDLGALAAANPLLDQATLNATEGQLHLLAQELQRVEGHDLTANQMRGIARTAATDKNFGKVMVAGLANGWDILRQGKDVLPEAGDILIDKQLRQMFQQVYNAIDDPGLLGRWFNEATNLFKTYATLTPGFHVRNAMSGLFMNASDGVSLGHQIDGLKLWRQFENSDPGWLGRQSKQVQDAFDAVFGSGAGGRYSASEISGQSQWRWLDKVISNPATRLSQRAGQRIEGSMRLGMALDSVAKGESVMQAQSRITRIHFDYSQVSNLDQKMKRIIPFWTFMSRNLPLQITQMWMNPAAYRVYDAAVANFSAPNDEFTPEYWDKLGTWNTGLKVGSMPLYFQPDFGFTRMNSDIASLTSPATALSQGNPVFGVPLDFVMNRDSFYQREFGPMDYTKQSGLIGTPLTAIAKMLPGNQTNEAGQVSDNLTNVVRGLIPPIDQLARLFPGVLGGGGDPQRQGEAMVRWLGAPARTLSDKQIENEKRNRLYDARDELARKRAMAQAIMSG